MSPSSGIVPPNGQVLITAECAPEHAGYISEVCGCACVYVCHLCLLMCLLVSVCLHTYLSVSKYVNIIDKRAQWSVEAKSAAKKEDAK